MKFEVRKHFIREGAYFTVGKCNKMGRLGERETERLRERETL